MSRATSARSRVVLGECLAPSLKPARFVFREPEGKVLFQVEQVSPFGFWSYTKFRRILRLELAWSAVPGGRDLSLVRPGGWRKEGWELRERFGGELFRFASGSFWGTSWTITNAQTGAGAVAKLKNPFVVGPQSGAIASLSGQSLATLQWGEFSWRLGCKSQVRIELLEDGWDLAAMAFAVIRWAAHQQR